MKNKDGLLFILHDKYGLLFTLLALITIMFTTVVSIVAWAWFYLFFMDSYPESIRIGVGLAGIGLLLFFIYRLHISERTKEVR